MDPAAYARAYGIQSEANRVTVTRVAGNEITYRRAVENYRRRMNSTMGHIQQEQKKLKRNVRDYRRKLCESQNTPVKRPKPFKYDWIASNSDSNVGRLRSLERQKGASSLPTLKTTEHLSKSRQAFKDSSSDSNSKRDTSPAGLQEQVDTFLKNVDEYVHDTKAKKQDSDEKETSGKYVYDKNGRRRFLFGASELGNADVSKDLESDTDGNVDHHDLLSDDSDDEGKARDSDVKRTAHSRNGAKPPRELVRLGSVYFKAIESKESDDHRDNDVSDETTPESAVPVSKKGDSRADSNDEDKEAKTLVQVQGQDGDLPPSPNDLIKPTDIGKRMKEILTKERYSENESDETAENGKISPESPKIRPPEPVRFKKTVNSLNFGDLMKFQHGVNTKKLFSMVDQLATKYGVLKKGNKNNTAKNRMTRSLDSERLAPESENSTEAKPSIFYAMNYGYGKSGGSLRNDDSGSSEIPSRKTTSKHLQTLREDDTEWSNTDRYSPNEEDSVDSPTKKGGGSKLKRLEFPHIVNADSSTSRSGQSLGSDIDERENRDTLYSSSQSPRTLKNSELANRRRSNLADASNYMSEMRRKNMMEEHDKVFGLENKASRFGQRRLPVSLRKRSIHEHQRKAEDRKIAWSSALGRMKLIHTLVDLTQFI